MTTVLITGDRSNSLIYPGVVALEMMRAMQRGDEIATTDNQTGVDTLVVAFGRATGVPVTVLPLSAHVDRTVGYDAIFSTVMADKAVFVHSDPHASSLFRDLTAVVADPDLVTLVTPETALL